jgi:hypothetical protein
VNQERKNYGINKSSGNREKGNEGKTGKRNRERQTGLPTPAMLKASSAVEGLGFDMAKPAKSDQLGQATPACAALAREEKHLRAKSGRNPDRKC